MNWRIKSLKDVVIVLAADADAQLDQLQKMGLPEGIDEIALQYDDIAAAGDDMLRLREIDKHQYDAVKKLNELLSRMSGKAHSKLWTSEALVSAPEWNEVRSAAKECLSLLEGESMGRQTMGSDLYS